MSKRLGAALVAVLLVLSGLFVGLGSPESASASIFRTGCHTKKIDKAEHWKVSRKFNDYDVATVDVPHVTLRMRAFHFYVYCPNYPLVYPSIRTGAIRWCWQFANGDRPPGWADEFSGVRFRTIVKNKRQVSTDPAPFMVGDNGEDLRCETQSVSSKWITLHKTWWRAHGTIVRHMDTDVQVPFRKDGSLRWYIHPADDTSTSGWY